MTQVINIIAVVLTIAVLSRIVGTNPLFRAAQYLFVGVSLGLAFVIAFHQVLMPAIRSLSAGASGSLVMYGVPLLLGLLLIPRAIGGQEFSWLANLPLALIFGVGAALAVSGAVIGTLLPQILDSTRPIGTDSGAIIGMVVLTIGTVIILAGFYYTVPPKSLGGRIVGLAAIIGHWLLMIAFGFFFAGTLQTYLSALTERLNFVLDFILGVAGIAR
jgi:ABC-type cobalamin transport system permease subunit